MDVYYSRECGIDDADVARLIGARSEEEREALRVVLGDFFKLDGGIWTHKRCDQEIQKYQDKQRKASESASARWKKTDSDADDMRTHSDRSAKAMRTHSEGNAPNNQEPITTLVLPNGSTEMAVPPSASPATPAPAFEGDSNIQALNGKSVVPIASAWELPEAWGVDAEALGWKPAEILREAEKFRQYWVAGKGLGTRRSVRGWRQSWSNWLEKAAKDKR